MLTGLNAVHDQGRDIMTSQTALYAAHKEHSANFISVAGYELPLHYGSQISEHHAVRQSAGMFDVSHMTTVDVHGASALSWLRQLLSNDVAKLTDGRALYTCMCREDGGVLDDLIVYRLAADRFRLISNAATREKNLAWLEGHKPAGVELHEVLGTSTIAVQGPDAVKLAAQAVQAMGQSMSIETLRHFAAVENNDWFIGRTGFTGEDGVEISLPDAQAVALWQSLVAQGVNPAGFGARDTLRLEAGLCLYGQDLDEDHSPAESGIASTIDITDPDREFIGREILEDHKMFGGRYCQIGLVLDGAGTLDHGQSVERVGREIGTVTSGGFSPTREASILMARVDKVFKGGCDVNIGHCLMGARVASVPFVPHGRARE